MQAITVEAGFPPFGEDKLEQLRSDVVTWMLLGWPSPDDVPSFVRVT